MKTYLKTIKFLQTFFLGISIASMLLLPLILSFHPDWVSPANTLLLYDISHISVFFVMLIRPLADIFLKVKWIRSLVILRKGVGVFSAAVVMSFIFSKIIMDPVGYFSALGTSAYWSPANYALLAHLADISAIILLATSNNLSKRIMGALWKKVQKLSYVFFYASSLFVFLSYGDIGPFISMIIITFVTILAYLTNRTRVIEAQQANPQTV
ncbi:hypothetical protein IPH92_03025 [Candidatus Kaiserbacteria bacterium]|nr:MAG: hypothetical protein IPH92_03025 [Candidatus Kaiserbacteria bacterium]